MLNTIDNKDLIKILNDIHKEIVNLRKEVQYALNTDNNEHYISIKEISDKYNKTYQAVYKKVYNRVDITKIIKVRNLLSIPKSLVRCLDYKLDV